MPVSPSSSTDESIGATCASRVSASRSDALSPTMSSESWVALLPAEVVIVGGQPRVSSVVASETRTQRRVLPAALHGHGEELAIGRTRSTTDPASASAPAAAHDQRTDDLLRDENGHRQILTNCRSVVPAPALGEDTCHAQHGTTS